MTVNGRTHLLPSGATVADAIRAAGADPGEPGIAAAVGQDVVARAAWGETALADGAEVEVVRAAAGG